MKMKNRARKGPEGWAVGLFLAGLVLVGCDRTEGRNSKETVYLVKIWKSPVDSKTLFASRKWTFPHAELLNGKIPVLDAPTNADLADELYRIEVVEQSGDRKIPPEYYGIGRSEDKRLCLFSGATCIHRITNIASSEAILEDALAYLEARTRWTLSKRLDRPAEKS